MEKVIKNRKAWVGIVVAIIVIIGGWWGWNQYQNQRVKSIIDGTAWNYSTEEASTTYGQTLSGYDGTVGGPLVFLKGTNRVLTCGTNNDAYENATNESMYEAEASHYQEFNGTYTIHNGILTIKNSDGTFEISNLHVGKATGNAGYRGKRVTVPILLGKVKETNNQGVTKTYQLRKLNMMKYDSTNTDFPEFNLKVTE